MRDQQSLRLSACGDEDHHPRVSLCICEWPIVIERSVSCRWWAPFRETRIDEQYWKSILETVATPHLLVLHGCVDSMIWHRVTSWLQNNWQVGNRNKTEPITKLFEWKNIYMKSQENYKLLQYIILAFFSSLQLWKIKNIWKERYADIYRKSNRCARRTGVVREHDASSRNVSSRVGCDDLAERQRQCF